MDRDHAQVSPALSYRLAATLLDATLSGDSHLLQRIVKTRVRLCTRLLGGQIGVGTSVSKPARLQRKVDALHP